MGFVFISYARSDANYVEELVELLESSGVNVWLDRSIEHGAEWPALLEDRINNCSTLVVVMSQAARASRWVSREIQQAEARQKPIFPILLSGERFFELGVINYEDATSGQMPGKRFVERLAYNAREARGDPDRSTAYDESPSDTDHRPKRSLEARIGSTRSDMSKVIGGLVSKLAIERFEDLPKGSKVPSSTEVANLADGRPISTRSILSGHTDDVNDCAVSPDGQYLVSGSSDQTLRIWECPGGEPIRTLRGHRGAITSCKVASDGSFIASSSLDGTLRLWDPTNGKELRRISTTGSVSRISDLRRSMTRGSKQSANQEMRALHQGKSGGLTSCAVAPDGDLVVVGSMNRSISIYSPDTGEQLEVLTDYGGERPMWHVYDVSIASDGRTLVSASSDHLVRYWDLRTGKLISRFRGHDRPAIGCCLAPGLGLAASVSEYGSAYIWTLESGEGLEISSGPMSLNDCTFSPDGRYLVLAGDRGVVELYDPVSGLCLGSLEGDGLSVLSCAVSPDGTFLATSSGDTIRLWA